MASADVFPMHAYSLDLRERIVAAVRQRSQSQRAIADRFAVSTATVSRYVHQHQERDGDLSPKPIPGKPRRLPETILTALDQHLSAHPDTTIEQLTRWLTETHQVLVSPATVQRTLALRGWTHKKSRWWLSNEMKPSARHGEKR